MSTGSSNGEGQGEGSSGSGDGIGESAEKESSRIISRSAIFVQNGLAIKELPVILRKLQSKVWQMIALPDSMKTFVISSLCYSLFYNELFQNNTNIKFLMQQPLYNVFLQSN